MDITALRSWTDLVTLHADVEAGNLPESVFAIDLGAIAADDPNVPVVNRDPEAFFRATYLTADMKRLLHEVLGSLCGQGDFNRVLKLRTPFGGGKSHTLATLLHAARSPKALQVLPEADGLPEPCDVAVAVFDGEKFSAHGGKMVENGQMVYTMWGWLAWQIDPVNGTAYELMRWHDENYVSPGGDLIREMLTTGASGRPVLLLLDEVLKYMERTAAVPVQDSTVQRQAKDFLQNLTVEVSGSKHAALVYSLQWSDREALGNTALLQEISHLSDRVDQIREPVQGDEVLRILQRRLLGAPPDEKAAGAVAVAYAEVVTGMRRGEADNAAERQLAEEDGLAFRERLRQAYPFHPALVDLMRERWTALPSFQRTRGALRLLATCMHSIKRDGPQRALLGPGDLPLRDADVRVKLLKELGAENLFDPVITADIEGPNARAKRIDDRLARETPALSQVKPAAKLATAILTYSFGGLQRDSAGVDEAVPPGVTESELLAACIGPDLDSITAKSVLSDLVRSCLYLHFDGVRYCFKKDPNVTKLIEDAEEEISRQETQSPDQGPIRKRIRESLDERLAGQAAEVWPQTGQDVPDRVPRFTVAYLPLEFARLSRKEQEQQAISVLSSYGDRQRRYRNGLGLAVPDKNQVESLRRAVRVLLAVEQVESHSRQQKLGKDQTDQLRERKQTEQAAVESCFRKLYAAVWLPRIAQGNLGVEKIEVGGKPLQATGVHERVMELLAVSGTPIVYPTVKPRKVIERVRLGEPPDEGQAPRLGVKLSNVRDAFFEFLEPPRLESDAAIRGAVVLGVANGDFAYTSGAVPELGDDSRYQVSIDRVVLRKPLAEDEVDFDSGFIMVPSAVPVPAEPPPVVDDLELVSPQSPPTPPQVQQPSKVVRLAFRATRDQVFKAFPAIANLAEKSATGAVRITVEGESDAGFDPVWLRNAVQEPLDEADIEVEGE